MSRIRLIAALAATAVALLALPALSSASPEQVIKDCSDDGKFSRQYSYQDLKDAEPKLPQDLREYTDCEAMIRAALARAAGGGPGGGALGGGSPGAAGGSGGGFGGGAGGGQRAAVTPSGAAGTPVDVGALRGENESIQKHKPSLTVAGRPLTPAVGGLNRVASAANTLPTSLLVAILALMLLCAAAGTAAAWRRWPALVRAPLRLIRR
jgi:hypothetical protein